MIIECPECSSRFKVPDDRLKPGGIKVRCSRCKHVFRTMGVSPPPEPSSSRSSAPPAPGSGGGKAALGRLDIRRARVNPPAAASPLAGGAVESRDGLFDREDPFASTQFGAAAEDDEEPEEFEAGDSFTSLLERNEADGFGTDRSEDDGNAAADPFEAADPFSRDDPFASTQFTSDDEGIRTEERSGLAPLPALDAMVRPMARPAEPAPSPLDDDFLVDPTRAMSFQMPDDASSLPGEGVSVGLDADDPSSSDAATTGVKVKGRSPERAPGRAKVEEEAPFRPTGPVPRVTARAGGTLLPPAPQAYPSDGGPLQTMANVLLILLLLMTLFLTFVGFSNEGVLDFKALPAQVKASFGMGTYAGRTAPGPKSVATPDAEPAPAGGLKVVNVRHTYFPNKDGAQLFLVEGGVLNELAGPVREIRVQGKVLDGAGKVVASLTAPAGRTLSEEELLDVTAQDSLDGAYAQVSKEVEKMLVGPSKATNFTLVFMNLPPEAAASRSFEVEVAGYADQQ